MDKYGQKQTSNVDTFPSNNVWFRRVRSGRTLIFVHGVLSSSATCWLNENKTYWPELIASDFRFKDFSIFLGGYYTSVDAGKYDVRQSSTELLSALRRVDEDGEDPALSSQEIIFVCHSTGGIVVRHILTNHFDLFRNKRVGLVLIASPSAGSRWANWLGALTTLYGHAVGQQLQEDNWFLRELDAQFKIMLVEKRIPGLVGIEAHENHFVVHRKWVPDKLVVVPEDSAGRYWGPSKLLRATDHFTSVKPSDKRHPAHELLVDFCQAHFFHVRNLDETLSPTLPLPVVSEGAAGASTNPESNVLNTDRDGCIVDIGSVAPPREGAPHAEVRFSVTNTLRRRIKVNSIKLCIRRALEVETTMGATTAGPIDERYLFAEISHDAREVELLPTPHEVKADETEGFFLKMNAEEGYEYVVALVVHWKFLEMSEVSTITVSDGEIRDCSCFLCQEN